LLARNQLCSCQFTKGHRLFLLNNIYVVLFIKDRIVLSV
jgi:hypothetical protein